MVHEFRVHITVDGGLLKRLLAVGLLLLPLELGSETLTLTTSYPAPSGIYNRIITVGTGAAPTGDTLLARNAGRVGIGLGAGNAATLLDVADNNAIKLGNAYMSSGGSQFGHFAANAWFDGGTWRIPNAARTSSLIQLNDNTFTFWRTAVPGSSAWARSLTVDGVGNVGIQNGAPTQALDVTGKANVSQYVHVGNIGGCSPGPINAPCAGGQYATFVPGIYAEGQWKAVSNPPYVNFPPNTGGPFYYFQVWAKTGAESFRAYQFHWPVDQNVSYVCCPR